MSSIAGYRFDSGINPVTPTRVVVSHLVANLCINSLQNSKNVKNFINFSTSMIP